MSTPEQLATAPIRSLFFKYYTPTLISLLSIMLHQVINGLILGQKVGKEGLGAVGLYAPVVIVLVAISLPIMIGGGILIGKYIGAGTYEKAQQVFQFATSVGVLLGLGIAISTPFFLKPLANFLAGSKNVSLVSNLSDYMFWQLINLPFFFLRMFWGNFLSNDGSPKASRNGNLIAVVLNIVLDLVLIIGFDMGVKGASIGTAVAIFAATLYLFICIQRKKGHIGFKQFRLSVRLEEWKEMISFGLPTFASEISFSFGLFIINHAVIPYGALAVAAFGMVNYVSFIFLRMLTSAMLACLPIMSYNIGAKLPGRVLAVLKFSLVFTIVLGLLITTMGYFIPGLLVRAFSGSETAEFREMASNATSLYFVLFLAAGPNFILGAYFQSIKKTRVSVVINSLKGFVFVWLFLWLLPVHFNMGLKGVWLSRSYAEILALVLVGAYTFLNRKAYFSEHAIVPVVVSD